MTRSMKYTLILMMAGIVPVSLYFLDQSRSTTTDSPVPQAAQVGYEVHEAIEAGSYVYVRYQRDGEDIWIAAGNTEVEKGDFMVHAEGMEMRNFQSRALNRTFEQIFFVDRIEVVGMAASKEEINTAHDAAMQNSQTDTEIEAPGPGDILPIDGGLTISKVLATYPGHTGQKARLRARVVKVTENIMGKNWITLQDGTGTAPEDKLIVTSDELVEIGETVVVTGVIANDVSLGYGYDYKILLEQATFSN